MSPPENNPSQPSTTTGFADIHPDIIASHILTRLDGPSLASTASSSTTLHNLSSSNSTLWSDTRHSTWPSTSSPLVSHVISTFPPRAFFSQAFPVISPEHINRSHSSSSLPTELISAVDVRYDGKLVFSKVHVSETVTEWFRCSPFRIDLLEPKDVVPTPIRKPSCLTLSWILIDPKGRTAVNLSSHEPVAVERHWLTGEVQVRFASIVAVDRLGHVQCGIVVTCGGYDAAEMVQVTQLSLEVEDVDGTHLNGKDSLGILHGMLEGKRGTGKNRAKDGQRRYEEYVEMRRDRRESKLRAERALDVLCVSFGVTIVLGFLVMWCCCVQ